MTTEEKKERRPARTITDLIVDGVEALMDGTPVEAVSCERSNDGWSVRVVPSDEIIGLTPEPILAPTPGEAERAYLAVVQQRLRQDEQDALATLRAKRAKLRGVGIRVRAEEPEGVGAADDGAET